jgi:hypothetical protein
MKSALAVLLVAACALAQSNKTFEEASISPCRLEHNASRA